MNIDVVKKNLMPLVFVAVGVALVGITKMFPCEDLGGVLTWRACHCAGWAFLTGVFLDMAVREILTWRDDDE